MHNLQLNIAVKRGNFLLHVEESVNNAVMRLAIRTESTSSLLLLLLLLLLLCCWTDEW